MKRRQRLVGARGVGGARQGPHRPPNRRCRGATGGQRHKGTPPVGGSGSGGGGGSGSGGGHGERQRRGGGTGWPPAEETAAWGGWGEQRPAAPGRPDRGAAATATPAVLEDHDAHRRSAGSQRRRRPARFVWWWRPRQPNEGGGPSDSYGLRVLYPNPKKTGCWRTSHDVLVWQLDHRVSYSHAKVAPSWTPAA